MKTTTNNNKLHQKLKDLSKKKIIAVTKKQTIEKVQLAIDSGIYKIGENQIQEAEKKFKNFKNREKIELHFIGKLQSNKIKKAVCLFDVLQTVENKKQINKINREAEKKQKIQKIYIQINISKDPQKNGIKTEEIKKICKQIKENKNTLLCGVMTILKNGTPKEEAYLYYKKIKKIQKKLHKKFPFCKSTSMGMSNDYKEAIRAGATEVRLGTLLFGKKNEKINLYTFSDYLSHAKDKKNCFYFQKEKQKLEKTDKKNVDIYIYDKTYNVKKKNNEIIFINNHINKSGSNPLLLGRGKNIKFYDITCIYKQSPKGETTTCLGSRFNKEKKQHVNPSGHLVYAAIQLHVLGYKNIFGRLINITNKL